MSEFMRLKKIKGAEEYVNKSSYTIQDYEKYYKNFKNYFQNSNPIHLEIGTGKGDFLIGMAKNFPQINFIGIEKYPSVLMKALQKVEKENLKNIAFICMDASTIDKVFEKEIETIYLNFSDPWPKTKHHKRRLTSPIFLQKYEHLFSNNKKIIMKTDNQDLFEYSLITTTNHGYKIEDISFDLHHTNRFNMKTEYEERWSKKGYPIYYVLLTKE